MRVLLTGASGFLGRRTVDACLSANHEVHALGRGTNRPAISTEAQYHGYRPGDAASLPWIEPPFVLVHLAWNTSRRATWSEASRLVHDLAVLLDHWTERGLAHLVVAGSAEEFGAQSGQIDDAAPARGPLSTYGWSKRAAAGLVEGWCARTGKSAWWLRPFVVYGAGQSGDMLLPHAVRQAVARQKAQFSDGRQLRDFVFVDDVAQAFRLAVERPPQGFEQVNLGTGRATAVAEVLNQVATLLDAKHLFKMGVIARRAHEPEVQVASTEHAACRLGWRAATTWEQGLAGWCQMARLDPPRPAP